MPSGPTSIEVAAVRGALGAWYDRSARDLPWRRTPSLYGTVVSEFMLQQTQVATVLPYFARWLEAFPNFYALAAAPEEEVLARWAGLGYYSRARRLHALAKAVAAMPEPPSSVEGWLKLPGVGPYTAAAITSIAQGQPAAVVDGNVVRVLARLVGDTREFRDGAEAIRVLTPLADQLLDPANPGRHNQAVMELGALVCRPRAPLCLLCPVAYSCAARKADDPASIPRFRPKQGRESAVTRLWIERDGHLLIHRAPRHARRLAGIGQLPALEVVPGSPNGLKMRAIKRRTIASETFSETVMEVAESTWEAGPAVDGGTLEWVAFDALDDAAIAGPHKRWIRQLAAAVRHPGSIQPPSAPAKR